MDGARDIDAVRADFIERIAVVAQGEGLPRIAGRIFAALVFDGRPISFGELADSLQVSRGSISTSARLLEERGVIKRVSKPGERQDYFRVGDAPFVTMLRDAKERAGRAKAEIDETLAQLPAEADEVKQRLGDYAGFYGAIEDGLSHAIERLSRSGT